MIAPVAAIVPAVAGRPALRLADIPAALLAADPDRLCLGPLAESALQTWARLRLTRELIEEGHVVRGRVSLRLAAIAVDLSPPAVRMRLVGALGACRAACDRRHPDGEIAR